MCFKVGKLSVQRGIKVFREKGKISAMKEMQNLTTKNECFGGIACEDLTEEMKAKAFPVLMLMIVKRNCKIKTRDYSSPTMNFYSFKCICGMIAKESHNVATVDLPSFFLQVEKDEDAEDLILKITGAEALLLVESDEGKWRKHLRCEKGKRIICAFCNKMIYGTMNAALLSHKKLAKYLKK